MDVQCEKPVRNDTRQLGLVCLGPNLIRPASHATQWLGYDLLDVQCHHQGPSQLTRSHGEDAARRSSEGTAHPSTQMAYGHVQHSDALDEERPETQFGWRLENFGQKIKLDANNIMTYIKNQSHNWFDTYVR